MEKKIAAVVLTYNRKELVVECLKALLRQTRPPDRIVLVDNGSRPDTREHLEASGVLASPIVQYLRIDVNRGASKGCNAGLQAAFDAGYEWIWFMDDDAEPEPDACRALAALFDEPGSVYALASLVIDPEGRVSPHQMGRVNLTNPFGSLVRPITVARNERSVEIDYASFVGICINRKAIEKVGLPDERFYIHVDDVEYCTRVRRLGRILLVPSSVVLHKEAGQAKKTDERSVLAVKSKRLAYERLWRQYFIRRNSVYFMREHARSRLVLWLWVVHMAVRSALAILLFDNYKGKRLSFVFHSIRDGIAGEFDNDKPQRLLYGEGGTGS